ncbi:YncE family protein [Cyclobacterium plantarum]|uniref:YncE family protein n=1 Tax=Cyclobacterium plantarum TaxID=2716263 RepID=UPI003F6E6A62
MKKLTIANCLLLISLLFSCGTDPVELPQGAYEEGVLIVNEGAFGANDGEIFHFDVVSGEMETAIFEKVNNRPFAGLIQNMLVFGDYAYLVANTGKVEIVRSSDFMSMGAVEGELVNSRSLVTAKGKLFISDWGAYDDNYQNPDSFIAVVNDPTGGAIANTIPVSSRPEGLTYFGDRVLAACQSEGQLLVIDPDTETVEKTVPVTGTPFSFFDYGGKLYLYATDAANVYLHEIAPGGFEIADSQAFSVANSIYNGSFTLTDSGEIFVISKQESEDVVVKLSISSGSVIEEHFYSGNNFYGLGYDEATQTLYIGEHAGWQGDGSVLRVNSGGELIDQMPAGRGPSGFYFP